MDEHNMSMEELKVDDDEENVKEVSNEEDILGAQSLLMSESEDEDAVGSNANKSPLKKHSPKGANKKIDSPSVNKTSPGRTKRFLNSDDEAEPSKEVKGDVQRKNKISSLIDSDSDDDKPATNKAVHTRLILEDSDSSNERKEECVSTNDDSDSQPRRTKLKKKKSAQKSNKNKNSQETSNDDSDAINHTKSGAPSDSESDDSLANSARACNFEENNNDEESPNNKKNKNKSKVIRASAKKAMDEMQAIQSEQQRLHREANISIPYHKPKKYSLQDFLNRKTIIKPPSLQSNSPIADAVRSKNLKMTQEELEEYAKLMEERAKEATEFFKSESEDESENEVLKDNEGIVDKQPEAETMIESDKNSQGEVNHMHTEMTMNENKLLSKNILDEEEKVGPGELELTEEELAEILAQEERQKQEFYETPSTSKVLITEVIELPKLDMKTVKISPVKKPLPPPPPVQATPKPSINIKELLAKKSLTASPSLSGDPNKLIDLETGDLVERKPSGIENLMKRLMSTVRDRKSKPNETCSILSTENGKLEITKVNISLKEEQDPNKDPKPRAAYFELKKNLKEIIKKKRLEELHKKQEDEIEHNKRLYEDDDEEDGGGTTEVDEYEPDSKPGIDGAIEIDDEENAIMEDYEEDHPIDEDEDNQELKDDDNEVEDDEEEETTDDNEGVASEEDSELSINSTKTRNRIIKAFDDSDEEGDKDDMDFLKTQPPSTQPILFDTQNTIRPAEDKENELMALCSGTFDITQKPPSSNALMSQIPLTQNNGKPVGDDELMELCSGTFDEVDGQDDAENLQQTTKCNKILSSDEIESDCDDSNTKNRIKKLTKKAKKKSAKLCFSDDEDEEKQIDEVEIQEIEDSEDEPEQQPTTYVDYDSEENEIVVEISKKDCVEQAATFFEKEAELSESEWGSADEDERNLDKYDIELGDEDEFDKEKIRSELEQIHARKMLDEDMREVRKIQEMLFEDEEKDGVGRQRQFKWKNAETGFSLDDGARDEIGDKNNGDSGDELTEHQWRKVRYEREQFLREQGLKPGSQDMSTTLPNTTLLPTNGAATISTSVTTRKIQIVTTKKISVSNDDSKKSTPFLISKGIAVMNKKSVRGSFLVRDRETLKKLAGLTKGGAGLSANSTDMDDAAGTVSIKSIKPKNFVFATLTEEEHENMKRKADDLLNSSNENGKNFMKKPKIEPRRDKCLIDQLL
uniref:Claspin n=1 Tax=Stomoxys calcitrans TaxID=35570 RepID=A0A1I8NTF8_STOCA